MAIIQARLSILDEEIGPGLCQYLMQNPSQIKPVLYNSWEALLQQPQSIALIGADFWSEEYSDRLRQQGAAVIRMDEEHLTPYQPADQLMKGIYRHLSDQQIYLPQTVRTLYQKEVIAVCSPHGYDLQEVFSFVYALIASEKRRTLYLDFAYYSGFFEETGNDLGDLLYELDKHELKAGELLPSFVRTFIRLDYILPTATQMDLEDITGEDCMGLIRRLLQESEYELLVINLPVRPSFLRAVYASCSHMYSLQRAGSIYDKAQARLMEDLSLESEELTRLQIVPMPKITGNFSLDVSMYREILFGQMADFIRTNVLEVDAWTST